MTTISSIAMTIRKIRESAVVTMIHVPVTFVEMLLLDSAVDISGSVTFVEMLLLDSAVDISGSVTFVEMLLLDSAVDISGSLSSVKNAISTEQTAEATHGKQSTTSY